MYELRKYNDFTIAEYFRKQGAVIGEDNRIMVQSLGQDSYLIKIGNHCSISPGVTFVNHDGAGWVFRDEEDPSLQKFGKIEIKDNCFIGIACIILPNVTIGPNSVVGAGSVVTKDVAPGTVVAGNPAREICSVGKLKDKLVPLWNGQKPPEYCPELKKGRTYSADCIQQFKTRDRALLKEHLVTLFWTNDRGVKGC